MSMACVAGPETAYLLPSEIPQEWRDVLLDIPGYDSIATAGDAFFGPASAQLAIDFFPECLRHVEGDVADKPFVLESWQKAIVANIFGWKRRDGKGRVIRRYREVFLFIARKNGKTPLVAGLALLVFFTDKEKGQQGFIAASTKIQAGKLFRHAKGMVDREPYLKRNCKAYGGNAPAGQAKSFVREEDNSFLQVVAADGAAEHGGNPSFVVIDELHVQKNRELVDAFQSAMISSNRPEPLFVCITTSDYDRISICNEKYDFACKVRDGIIPTNRFLPVIYEVDRKADWTDERHWKNANPNLGVSVSLEDLREECKRAQHVPAYECEFRRLSLNQRTSTAERCIPMSQWDACKRDDLNVAALVGQECFAGLDIGATSDFCALARLFPHNDVEIVTVKTDPGEAEPGEVLPAERKIVRRSYTLLMDFWLPADPVRRDANMQATIEVWRKANLIRTTPGNAVDYDMVLEDIVKILKPYRVRDVAFDYGFQGLQVATNLMKIYGASRVHMVQQGIMSLAAPFRELLELLPVRRIHHDGNECMRWQVSNTVGERVGGLLKPSKKKSTEKIDGVTALVMALKGALSAASSYQAPYGSNSLRD